MHACTIYMSESRCKDTNDNVI